jgi:hypothetical protein
MVGLANEIREHSSENDTPHIGVLLGAGYYFGTLSQGAKVQIPRWGGFISSHTPIIHAIIHDTFLKIVIFGNLVHNMQPCSLIASGSDNA